MQAAGRVGARDQLRDDGEDAALCAPGQLGAAAMTQQQLAQAAVGDLLLEVALQELADARPGILELARLLGDRHDGVELRGEELVEQRLASRKATIDRADADLGHARDLVVADVEAVIADQGTRRFQDPPTIALGVASQRRSSIGSGHP